MQRFEGTGQRTSPAGGGGKRLVGAVVHNYALRFQLAQKQKETKPGRGASEERVTGCLGTFPKAASRAEPATIAAPPLFFDDTD